MQEEPLLPEEKSAIIVFAVKQVAVFLMWCAFGAIVVSACIRLSKPQASHHRLVIYLCCGTCFVLFFLTALLNLMNVLIVSTGEEFRVRNDLSYQSKQRFNKRKRCQGLLRLNTEVERSNDIYALLVAASFKPELIMIKDIEEATEDEVVNPDPKILFVANDKVVEDELQRKWALLRNENYEDHENYALLGHWRLPNKGFLRTMWLHFIRMKIAVRLARCV
jgi:hypothetical protein